MMNPVIFREYDIRGVYGKDFDESFAELLAKAHTQFIKNRTGAKEVAVSIGYDARLSSPSLATALEKGYVTAGAKVYRLGMVTTPISYFSTFQIPELSGGIMVTGSHNPPEYNGFKISVGKFTIYGEDIQELHKIIDSGNLPSGSGTAEDYDILTPYVDRYKKEFQGLKDVGIVLDCGNGAAGCVTSRLYEALNLKPSVLFEKPDGTFPNHHPDPTVEKNLVALKKEVAARGAAVGIGFDGDCDRIGVVDSEGNTIPGDELMVLVARSILKDNPGAPIIGDVKCSDRLYKDIEKNGGRPIMWKTGHSLIKAKIRDEKAPFGGEMSGHIFFADRNYGTDDALYASLRIVEILSKSGKTIPQLLEGLPGAFNTPELRIDTTEEKKKSIVADLIEKYSKPNDDFKINLIDGIRLSFKDGWALARSSNTQPVLVLRFESLTKEGLGRIQTDIESFVQARL